MGRRSLAVVLVLGGLSIATWAMAQTRPLQAPPMDPAYRQQLEDAANASHDRFERERARRLAPFDLWWGVR